MLSDIRRAQSYVVGSAIALIFASFASTPAEALQGGEGWRALCVPGNEVEILVGGEWYRGIVTGPDPNGEEYCGVTTTAYTGRAMDFAMAPERMRAIQAPDVAGPPVGPAPKPGELPREQQAWRALCEPGTEVEILIGSAWYKSTVIGPDKFGGESCGVLNTSYSGRPMEFAMAPDRMRRAATAAPRQPTQGEGDTPLNVPPAQPAAPPLTASLAEIGEAYRGNTPAARQRYEKRTVTLTGTLNSVGSDYIRLNDGPFGVAMCNFDEGDREQLAALQRGARLTVQGDDTWWGWDTFQLKSCRILDQQTAAQATPPPDRTRADGRPPLGRYVCRQYMTTIGYIQLGSGSYTVNGVRGSYSFDERDGLIRWNGGAYAGWPARYEFSPAGAGHAQDERIIRMTDETGDLKIDCFLTAE